LIWINPLIQIRRLGQECTEKQCTGHVRDRITATFRPARQIRLSHECLRRSDEDAAHKARNRRPIWTLAPKAGNIHLQPMNAKTIGFDLFLPQLRKAILKRPWPSLDGVLPQGNQACARRIQAA
jgi:hypothetical protein